MSGASDTLKTCDVFDTIAMQRGMDAATKFMRDVNHTRLEREIEAEQARQYRLIAQADELCGRPRDVSKRDPWLAVQERITRSFAAMEKLLEEYEACK